MGDESFRPALVPNIFQVLHGKGLGHTLLRAQSRMGRAAHQRPVAEDGVAQHVRQTQKHHQDSDRSIRLPAARTRDDVERGQGRSRKARRLGTAQYARWSAIQHGDGKHIDSVVVACNGHREIIHGTDFISSMPVTEFIKKLDPAPPAQVLQAAEKLKYRDFLTVCLIVNKAELFSDNWIYVHDPEVKVGRIQNFKNWSPHMVPDPTKSSLGLEYFCTEGDELWTLSDAELIELGKRELDRIGLVSPADIEDGCVFRVPKAYPIYDSEYRDYLDTVKNFVRGLENYQTIGRNGLHRYNNQDHAMVTGMLSVRKFIVWRKKRSLERKHRSGIP